MLKRSLAISLLVGLTIPVFGQKEGLNGGDGRFSFGYARVQVDKLQQFLPDDASDLSLREDHFVVGGQGSFIFNDLIVSLEGYALEGASSSSPNWSVGTSGGIAQANVGYDFANSQRLLIAPKIGGGVVGHTTEIDEEQDVDFSDVQGNPNNYGRTLDISQSGPLLHGGLRLDYYLIFNQREKERGGLLASLEAGYWYQPASGDWSYEGGSINNAPDYNFEGFYVQLGIGGGGFGPAKEQ
jgi:hypothetical protein